jgi:NAD(P)-dependent dehydrogenase (short-subunit alcohol dehydrogenase family)
MPLLSDMNSERQEKICLITGASRGLGKALAEHFWRRRWNLVLVARKQQALDEVACFLGEKSDQTVHTIVADLAQPNQIEQLVETAKSLVPRLDALINNAGIQGAVGPVWKNDWDAWLETLQVDLLAPVGLCRLIAPWMTETGGGSIISLSGGGATGPRANFSAYATAKAGLVRFSETLAEELKPYNIRVNCIAPGAMGTAMLEEVVAKGEVAAGKKEYEIALRILRESDASILRSAELCHFLASDASKEITGKLISAMWDPWTLFPEHLDELNKTDIYTLRRIVPKDRGKSWGNDK